MPKQGIFYKAYTLAAKNQNSKVTKNENTKNHNLKKSQLKKDRLGVPLVQNFVYRSILGET